MRFTKMQGCGNDYIYINCFEEKVENPEKLAIDAARGYCYVEVCGRAAVCLDGAVC